MCLTIWRLNELHSHKLLEGEGDETSTGEGSSEGGRLLIESHTASCGSYSGRVLCTSVRKQVEPQAGGATAGRVVPWGLTGSCNCNSLV